MQITKHLTRYEREKIEFYLRLKMGVRAIARKLDRDHSVISREIRRNRGSRVRYSAKLATRIKEDRRHRRKRRMHRARTPRKTKILERISIHLRPPEIGARISFGHWGSDSVIYPEQRNILSVQIERKTRLVRIHRAANRTAAETELAIRRTVGSLPKTLFQTMTFDNGTEGANHRMIRDDYGIDTYFCDAYASWQKGAVENVNGIIRRFLPKTKDLSAMTDREIYQIQETINDTPRKSLNYLTPNEVISQYLIRGGVFLG